MRLLLPFLRRQLLLLCVHKDSEYYSVLYHKRKIFTETVFYGGADIFLFFIAIHTTF